MCRRSRPVVPTFGRAGRVVAVRPGRAGTHGGSVVVTYVAYRRDGRSRGGFRTRPPSKPDRPELRVSDDPVHQLMWNIEAAKESLSQLLPGRRCQVACSRVSRLRRESLSLRCAKRP
ncbi:hypothetical protein Aca07nite_69650 [Actinoplanes capillaceus]|uniref:Transposase n=1 Tax=Actinoplanes campanulatus TaxID=113559 RepID=A0ABQ3WTR7_9ACTN|nr:hypothetical protein Aca07nite_69650 [Actinoplanes capillaceus]